MKTYTWAMIPQGLDHIYPTCRSLKDERRGFPEQELWVTLATEPIFEPNPIEYKDCPFGVCYDCWNRYYWRSKRRAA